MKNLATLVAITAVIATSSVQGFAMAMTGGAMMDKSSDTMMKHDTMMKDGMTMSMKKMSVAALAKHFGYAWGKDRKSLATMAGVTGYTGTMKQNLVIRAYLTSDKMMMKDGMMKDDKMMMKDGMTK